MSRLTAFVLAAAAFAAHAELYRWVDPGSGSVKFSNSPPAWIEGADAPAPRVDVIPYNVKPVPEAAPALAVPAAAPKPEAAPRPEAVAPSALEATWRSQLQGLSALTARPTQELGSTEVQRQVQSYESLSAELDRRDPEGIARRRAEQASVIERLRSKLGAGK